MKTIFISYRRIDSYEATRLAGSLRSEYVYNSVFLDFTSIPGGEKWPASIEKAVETAAVLIVVVGKNWLLLQDQESGRRRIDMENDWVRNEIKTFLNLQKQYTELLVLPVLINGAIMPDKAFLDAEINELCDFQAISLPNTMSSLDFVPIKRRLLKAKIYTAAPLPMETPLGEIPPDPLSQEEENIFLEANKSWHVTETEKPGTSGGTMRELYRNYEFKTYEKAWRFMSIISTKGIKPNNHHPRWQNTYNRVEVWLCTFNIGHNPSRRDLRLADFMEATWNEFDKDLK